ncbi:MAG TPA: DNA helicase [Gammaproteobacteria bacterium]|nr:DNA helicase [Gammaproteobacteria bacterium]
MSLVRIGFSDDFFPAVTKLPASIQAKVNNLVMKFQRNPKSSGLNYENLNVRDKNMRSLRVDQAYRVILTAPEEGNVYLFLWVDHHDKAYQWAERHTCRVNPDTGTVQLYSTVQKVAAPEVIKPESHAANLAFDALRDRQLRKLGVPEEQISLVRAVSNERDLDRLVGDLPGEAYEGLFYFIAGEPYESILLEREVKEEEQFDPDDFVTALERIQTQSKFVVAENESELQRIFNAPLDKWRVFLHPSQRRLATGIKNGPVRVLGGAGTGKTVVAMHRAKWLAKNVANDTKKVLFTTFTKNLAVDIRKNLESICSPDLMGRIEVVNLDRWVQSFLRKQNYDYDVLYDNKVSQGYWGQAMGEKPADIDLPEQFFQEEWFHVIQPQGVQTLEQYKKASRIGRGTRLNRGQRVKIWPVFEEYRSQLQRNRQKEVDDLYRDAAQFLQTQQLEMPYCSVIVDEAQDMGSQAFKLIRTIVPESKNDLFIVGDGRQRIYGRNKVVLSKCGINIRGRSRKLKINYRTTDEIRKWATALMEDVSVDDLDGGLDESRLYKSLVHGDYPVYKQVNDALSQADLIQQIVEKGEFPRGNICVVARTHAELGRIENLLIDRGVATRLIKPSVATDNDQQDCINLATVHRVKGLEFDQVILASANDGLIPLSYALDGKADQVSLRQAENEERSLVYVALTRARKSAIVISYGKKSVFFG